MKFQYKTTKKILIVITIDKISSRIDNSFSQSLFCFRIKTNFSKISQQTIIKDSFFFIRLQFNNTAIVLIDTQFNC